MIKKKKYNISTFCDATAIPLQCIFYSNIFLPVRLINLVAKAPCEAAY